MKQAVLIMAHNNVEQLNRLISFFDSEFFDVFIHLDKKSLVKMDEIKKCKKSKITIYSKYNIKWADYSQTECELFLLDKAATINNYEYFHLISGLDIPIKKLDYIYKFFHESNKEFIHFQSDSIDTKKISFIKYYHPFIKCKSFKNNKILKGLDLILVLCQKVLFVNRLRDKRKTYYTGANWFSITSQFAKYILDNKTWIKKQFNYTKSSDEFFIQTLIMNSNYKNNLYYDKMDNNYISCMRNIDWERGKPYVWKKEDFEQLIQSPYIFARKVDQNIDKEIIDTIYNKIT